MPKLVRCINVSTQNPSYLGFKSGSSRFGFFSSFQLDFEFSTSTYLDDDQVLVETHVCLKLRPFQAKLEVPYHIVLHKAIEFGGISPYIALT